MHYIIQEDKLNDIIELLDSIDAVTNQYLSKLIREMATSNQNILKNMALQEAIESVLTQHGNVQ